ncbi:tyrosine-type recombinase/integrase [Fibrella sp. WM1]|uniref:site-specific integrase n=1 Tax=Fibrella musci TaxID=3242485 RepID=UPI003520C517
MPRSSNSPVTYMLRDPKATKPTPITCVVRFNNHRINIGTGFKVTPEYWKPVLERVGNYVAAIDRHAINDWLDSTETIIKRIITDLKASRTELNVDSVKLRIKEAIRPVEEVNIKGKESALFSFIADFIAAAPRRVNIETGKHIQKRTIQKYETVLKVLKEFSTVYSNRVDFDTIDLDFYDAFTTYLTVTKEFATNNVGKYLQTLKVFLNDASSRGIQVRQDYRSRKFKVVKEDADDIYLNESELRQLLNTDLSKSERLEKVRDLFLVGCYTGLRFSDLTNLRPEYIKNGMIRIEQQKNSGKVVIPCHEVVLDMLRKYDGKLPRSISNQKMNDYLKEVCKMASINSIETKSQTKAGKRVTKSFEKWELVSTHTARRSFATNMYLMGIPAMTIMKITGHKTERSFMKYIKLDEEQHAKVMARYWDKFVTQVKDL